MPPPRLPPPLADLNRRIGAALLRDRRLFRSRLRGIEHAIRDGRPIDRPLQHLAADVQRSADAVHRRRATLPVPTFPADLPVVARRDDIAGLIAGNQVVVLCGETGSGKTTQLPKICLTLGRGVAGLIGHTQPRRIAARSVAARIADELGTPLGRAVGYKVRFGDKTGPDTAIKVMTDGILLAETQGDRFLEQYDTLIIDEAHERSLNIDFLLGYLKDLLPRRPDLKVIITSATIDPERFSHHFNNAPIIEVSGRTYPVEVRYRPLPVDDTDDTDGPPGAVAGTALEQAILDAVDELSRGTAAKGGSGDILVFLSGEREIRETAEALRKHHPPGVEILPLYARLSSAEQMRVFQPHRTRRIVLATNVAETSLTVPGIRYVVDPGLARISRYSHRTKVQRLPIEPISQASADQRKGRCGRTADGVCIRLYSEEDYLERPRFTDPEILRTNLAGVILQMTALRLGDPETFPFLEPPDHRAIRDGYETLVELGAVEDGDSGRGKPVGLTKIGAELARLPTDPRIGRMVLAANEENCLAEVLVIAAALSVQDPRDRPLEAQDAADAAHARFRNEDSDFLTFLNLWSFYQEQSRKLSGSKLRKLCRTNFLSSMRMREWAEVHAQLHTLISDMGYHPASTNPERQRAGIPTHPENRRAGPRKTARSSSPAPPSPEATGPDRRTTNAQTVQAPLWLTPEANPDNPFSPPHPNADAIHRALLAGLLGNVGLKTDPHEYTGARTIKFNIFPGSGLFKKAPKWVMAAELVKTTRLYARTAAKVQPEWIERLGDHLLKRTYSEPHWDKDGLQVAAYERVTLYGLELVARRRVHYGPIDPRISRDLFIHHALVEGDLTGRTDARGGGGFMKHNADLIEQVQALEAKSRRRDVLVDVEARFAFYDRRVPEGIYNAALFEGWRKREERANPKLLFMTPADLMRHGAEAVTREQFPDTLTTHAPPLRLPLEYHLEPGHPDDGVTATVPIEALNRLRPEPFEWLVPGLIKEKITELIRALPKAIRVNFVPAPEFAAACLERLPPEPDGPLLDALSLHLGKLTGIPIPADAWQPTALPPHLHMNFRVVDAAGKPLATGRDLPTLRRALSAKLEHTLAAIPDTPFNRDNITLWDFPDLPDKVEVSRPDQRTPSLSERAAIAKRSVPRPSGSVAAPGLHHGDHTHAKPLSPPSLLGYPALIDHAASVSLRLLPSPEAAARATRRGLRRLFILQVQPELTSLINHLPGVERLCLQYAPMGSSKELKEQLIELTADRAFLGERGNDAPPRTKAAFTARLEAGWTHLGAEARRATDLTGEILAAYAPIALRLAQPVPPGWAGAVADIRSQLAHLLPKRFLTTVPYAWLRHAPRYLTAIHRRLQKLAAPGPERDAKHAAEVAPHWRNYLDRAARHNAEGTDDPELHLYRWMIEELRVSLFAQDLKTAIPASPKRLQEQWANVRP